MIGQVGNNDGLLFETGKYKVAKKIRKAGQVIDTHKHPSCQIVFSIISGQVEVVLAQTEKHQLQTGDILHFDGANSISATMLTDAQIQVVLIEK